MRKKAELRKINIQNIHPRIRVRKKSIEALIQNILSREKVRWGVDVILVDDHFMRQLNRKFTRRKGTTDVLSFGMGKDQADPVEYPNLGDIYVSLDQAKRQAKEYRVRLQEEVLRLVAHGLLHLLGYDHASEKEESIMREKEKVYLEKVTSLLNST